MARYNRNTATSYDTLTAFAAACAAQRINGAYLKQDLMTFYEDGGYNVDKIANKVLMHQFLNGTFDITDADREQGEKVRQYCHGFSFKIITGNTLTEFEQAMITIADKESVNSNYDLAVIASLPASYERAQVRIGQNARLRDSNGSMTNEIGSKIETTIEVVRCNYSNTWETYYVTGLTNDKNVVFFAFKNNIEVGSNINIKGKVKAHKEDRTQLSHVKVL